MKPDLKTIAVALLLFFLLAIGLTWPLVLNLDSHLPAGSDSIVHFWNGWWVKVALANGQSPYQTDLFFAPNGLSLVYHNFAWVHIIGWLSVSPFTQPVAAYNLILLLNLTLCGLLLARLAWHLTQNKTAAFLAGLIYIAWPYRLTQPDHPNLHSTWPIPLFMLALIRLLERRRWQDGVLCGLAFALIGYMRWQLLIPTVFIAIVYLFVRWFGTFRTDSLAPILLQIRPLFVAAFVALVCLAPPITLLAIEWQQNPAQLVLNSEVQSMQTDLLAYVTPPPWNSIVGTLTEPLYSHYYPNRGSRSVYSPFIGFTTLMLCAIALWRLPWRKTLPWLAIGFTLILLALGPTLRINGAHFDSVPTFYQLLERFFIIKLLREPDRFNMFVALPAAVLAAYGATHLLTMRFFKNRQLFLAGLLSLIILAEYLVIPLPLQSTGVSFFYKTVQSGPGAVLDIPLDPFKSKPYMLAQITHGRPIAQGHASRYPENAFAYLENNPWLNETLLFDGQPPLLQDVGRQFAQLHTDGFEFLLLHKTLIPPDYITKWKRTIPLVPSFEDDELLVYKIGPLVPENFKLLSQPLPNFGPLNITQSASCQNPEGVLGIDVAWGQLDDSIKVDHIDIQLRLQNGDTLWAADLESLTGLDLSQASYPTFFLADYEWDLPADIEPGRYTFELQLQDKNDDTVLGTLEAPNLVDIQAAPCLYKPPAGSSAVNAQFGDTARLLSYQLEPIQDGALPLALYWRPEQRTGVEYTVFVHLFDLAGGQPVAQNDAMPRNWSYPTSRWGLGETIDEQIELLAEGLGPGSYGVGVGLYNAQTGERLPIVTADGEQVADGRLILQTVIID